MNPSLMQSAKRLIASKDLQAVMEHRCREELELLLSINPDDRKPLRAVLTRYQTFSELVDYVEQLAQGDNRGN